MDEERKALIENMIAGDEAAFDMLYRFYSKKLYRMAYFITGNQSDSEDILQETFIKCFLHRSKLRQPERFESWICQILVRTVWRMEKKKKGKAEISFDGLLESEENTGAAERIQEDTENSGPIELVLQKESFQELGKAVNHPDVRYRTVVLLYYYNDMNTKEIARVCGILEGTVKSRLYRAREQLKEQLECDSDKNDIERRAAVQ